ncbi:hypothetical protein ABZ848_49325 [Streptomyces sp. NPDC047081]|uniref:hypothetical protein n=1 Tax=Streptomyces sp. NPDC047081 TaxID=3154706 RepID=UPI00340AE1BB
MKRLPITRGRLHGRSRDRHDARTENRVGRHRTVAAAALSSALIALTAGCGGTGHHSGPESGTSRAGTPGVTSSPGRLSVRTADVDLTITGAVAHLDRSGDGSLTMSIRNDGAVPEHLGMVATPDMGRGVLEGGKTAEGNGSLSTAGILLQSGTAVAFRGDGPRVELHHVHGVTTRHTLPLSLQFGVAGLVRLQARVEVS